MTGRLLTTRELAEQLGVSAETVLRWVKRGQLPGIRLPSGALRFPEATIEQWLASRAAPTRGASTTLADAAPPTLSSVGSTTPQDEE